MHFEDGCGHDLRRLDQQSRAHESEWWQAARAASRRGVLPVDENEAPRAATVAPGARIDERDALRRKQADVLRFLEGRG